MAKVAADSVWFNATSTGTVDFVVASAVSGYRTPATAAIPNGSTIHYVARNGSEWENGEGVYTTGTVTLSRVTIYASSNANAKVSFTAAPTVAVAPLAEDVIFPPASTVDGAIAIWSGTGGAGLSALQSSNLLVSGSTLSGGNAANTDFIIQSTTGAGTSDDIIFKTGSQVERLRIDSGGRFIFGGSGALGTLAIGGNNNQLQNMGSDAATGAVSLTMFSATAGTAAHLDFYRSKSGTVGTATVVASGDNLGEINFWGAQQTGTFATQNAGARITAEVDGTVTSGASGDMPGRLRFFTTPDASGTPVERVRIKNDGAVVFNIAGTPALSPQISASVAAGFIINNSNYFNMAIETYSADAFFGGLAFGKSRNATAGSHTVVQNGDQAGLIWFFGSDGAAMRRAGQIECLIDGSTISASSMPGRLTFGTTPSGSVTFSERLRIDNAGAIYLVGVGTTATAGNAFIDNATSPVNKILRSTSSRRYKTNIKPVSPEKLKAVLALSPVEYNSLATADDPKQMFYGLTAEDVAEIDPALVGWSYLDSDREYHKVLGTMVPKSGAKMVPDFVMYDRVLLLQIAALKMEVEQLKGRMA